MQASGTVKMVQEASCTCTLKAWLQMIRMSSLHVGLYCTIRDEALYTRDPVDQSWQPGKLLNVYTGNPVCGGGADHAQPYQPWISCAFRPRISRGRRRYQISWAGWQDGLFPAHWTGSPAFRAMEGWGLKRVVCSPGPSWSVAT